MTKTRKLTATQQKKALAAVAAWLGRKGYGTATACNKCAGCAAHDAAPNRLDKSLRCDHPKLGPAPTGRHAADHALGPVLVPDWDWPSTGPCPTLILEGGPEDWAIWAAMELRDEFTALGIFAEPYSAWALCLYPY